MNSKKIFGAISFVVVSIFAVSFLWRKSIILCLVLFFLAFIKHRLLPIKKEALWFLIVSVLGSTTESLIIFFGGGPWRYAVPQLGNIPFWLIPLWGIAGTIFITLHEGVLGKRS